jgi:copper chaperone
MAVTKALDEIEGITNAKVDLEKARAVYDETAPVDLNRVKEAIKKAGYQIV